MQPANPTTPTADRTADHVALSVSTSTLNATATALGAGATGIYLDARPAGNFASESVVGRAARLCRANGASLYVSVDGVLLPGEIDAATTFAARALALGAHGVSLSDLGLLDAIRAQLPAAEIVVAPRANVHDAHTLRAFARAGASRIALAPQLSLSQVEVLAAVAREEGVVAEILAHGPMCVSYAGQCTLSSMTGQGADSRGECAGLCRNEYELVDLKGGPVETVGTHLLSTKDFTVLPHLATLVASGVGALRIGGRDATPAMVVATTSVYREALDRVVAASARNRGGSAKDPSLTDAQLRTYERRLIEGFNRGLTSAYLTHVPGRPGEAGAEMMSLRRPENQGVPAGRVTWSDRDRADIAFEFPVRDGDILEIRTRRGRFTQQLSNVPGGETSGKATVRTRLKSYAQAGDRVFRLRSRALELAARDASDLANAAREPLTFFASARIGKPLSVTAIDSDNVAGTATGTIVEEARTRAVSAAEVAEHVDRLGNTAYRAAAVEVDIDDNVGIGFSEIHRVRAAAIEAYQAELARVAQEAASTPRVIAQGAVGGANEGATEGAVVGEDARATQLGAPGVRSGRGDADLDLSLDVVAAVEAFGGAKAALNAGAALALVPAANLLESETFPGVVAVLPRVAPDAELDELFGTAERYGAAVASTLGQIETLAARGVNVAASWSLGVASAEAAAALASRGATFIWLSPELSGFQVAEIAAGSPVPVGIAVAGLPEVLVSEHCIMSAASSCDGRCDRCALRKDPHALRDRLEYHFPLRVDARGRTRMFNSVPLDLTDQLAELIENGVAAVRLDLETALTSSVSAEVARVRHRLLAAYAGDEQPTVADYVTRGRYFRSIG